jgi:leucyl-tRNA---protein transferase
MSEGRKRDMKQELDAPAFSFRDDFPCVYFDDGRTAFLEYCVADPERMDDYHKFLATGYRRLGSIFYKNVCETCSACRPIRIVSARFVPSRSQKRTFRANKDVRIEITSAPSITPGKVELYAGYLSSKHGENRTGDVRVYESLLTLHCGYAHTMEMDYYLGGRLIGVGIVDEGRDSLSSNYFYYDTDFLDRRLGVFSILSEIALACSLKKKYYYLGFYIEETPKMCYKKHFRPNQIFKDGEWKDFLG